MARNYSKHEYEKIFNELLGTNIKWSKLSKEELSQLAVIFANPEILLKRLGVEVEQGLLRKRVANALGKLLENVEYEGPIITFFKEMFGVSRPGTVGKGGKK